MVVIIFFWILFALILYSYFGYTLLLLLIASIKRLFNSKNKVVNPDSQPDVTLVVAAYNEEKNIEDKIQNTLLQDYPTEKLTQLWVNDSSTDGTKNLLLQHPNITIINQSERRGKIAAINTAMQQVKTPITIFSDANAMLSANALKKIIEPFSDPKVGCVAGEKRIQMSFLENAAATGEGVYWRYESLIKKLESNCGSTLSATGELFAIRTELFEIVDENIILDDFLISTNIIKKGYSVKYVPEAHACEKGSANIIEEKKRKVRIAAGSFQALLQSMELINPFKHPMISFQFFSHKILRWFVLPLSLVLIPLLNILILFFNNQNPIYIITLLIQLLIFLAIFLGWQLKDKHVSFKWIFLPYYLFMMNISIVQGFIRFVGGKQNVKWDKSLRQT